jgi:predicted O-methyltransferase YrrM
MRNKIPFNGEYYKRLTYIRTLYDGEDELLKTIRYQSKFNGVPITINPEEGQMLSILSQISGANKILEIGTLFGYSTIWLARSINNGFVTTIERDKNEYKIANDNFKKANLTNKIESICGDARIEMENLIRKNKIYDMVFIDADKINYPIYLDFTNKLLKNGGLIVADNTMLSGTVHLDHLLNSKIKYSTQQAMKTFNTILADKKKYKTIMINNDEGLSIAIKL